tara:strand:+ start:1149 stop:1904 length:756 start_codon:yes stop_codon:yes gene_type:complete
MKIAATIQVRMGSSRLPGKVLKKIEGKSILEWQIQRIKKSLLIDEIIVATTDQPQDDVLAAEAQRLNVGCWRGSENDVLSRVHEAFCKTSADIHVEFYGDSPFVDSFQVDQMIGYLLKNISSLDYLSNAIKTTYPPGLEVSVYKASCLLDAQKNTALDDPLREHVGPNIKKNKSLRIENIVAPSKFNYPEFYFEIDTQEDFTMLEQLLKVIVAQYGEDFSTENLIEAAIKNPKIIKINTKVHRRWKQFREE